MQLTELIGVLEDLAPTRLAEPWDNVGLLVGDPAQTISKVMLTIDYTAPVAEEARNEGCDAIVAYHPPIFDPLKRVAAGSLIFDAIRRGVAIYSPHTALDIADGGTNDLLADVLGLAERQPLRISATQATAFKLVVFVPESHVETVSRALFEAGCGRIGDYSSCSFRSPGTGTFFGAAETRPTVGEPGRLEQVPELRLETVVPVDRVQPVLNALRQAHPYEEPAFDLVQLGTPPENRGQGRIGNLLAPIPAADVLVQIKEGLEVRHLLVAGPVEGVVRRAACGAGACGDLLNDAITQKADLYLTGEMRHHDALKAIRAGMTVVCTLHSNSERAVLKRVADRLSQRLPGLAVHQSRVDRDPFAMY